MTVRTACTVVRVTLRRGFMVTAVTASHQGKEMLQTSPLPAKKMTPEATVNELVVHRLSNLQLTPSLLVNKSLKAVTRTVARLSGYGNHASLR